MALLIAVMINYEVFLDVIVSTSRSILTSMQQVDSTPSSTREHARESNPVR